MGHMNPASIHRPAPYVRTTSLSTISFHRPSKIAAVFKLVARATGRVWKKAKYTVKKARTGENISLRGWRLLTAHVVASFAGDHEGVEGSIVV